MEICKIIYVNPVIQYVLVAVDQKLMIVLDVKQGIYSKAINVFLFVL